MRALFLVLGSLLSISCGDEGTRPNLVAPTPPTPSPTVFTVSGTVRDDAGRPVASAQVGVGIRFSKTGPAFASMTDAAGVFSGSLPPGSYEMSVGKDGYQWIQGRSVVVTGDLRLDVTLLPGVIVSGIVDEAGVGPLEGATVSAFAGSELKLTAKTGPGVPGSYSLQYLLPGTYTLRVTKDGYDTQEKTVEALIDTRMNFELKWSYGSCLKSVSPVLFDSYASAGGTSTVSVDANPGKSWTATTDVPWLQIASGSRTGPGPLMFRVDANPRGAFASRKGAVMIRCSAQEGQNVWITQLPDCEIRLEAAPDMPDKFPAAGGIGRVLLRTGTPNCAWQARSQVDWTYPVGVSSWSGDFDPAFVVKRNTTGVERTGTILFNETRWSVTQLP